jgi:predicted permease
MWKDLIFAVRTLRRNGMFTAVAMLSLALGIGASTAIFSLMDQVMFRLLPIADPQRLVLLHREYSPNGTSTSDNFESVFSYPTYRDLRDHDPVFSGTIARASARVALSYRTETQGAAAEVVSGNFFETLGVGASIGRVLAHDDDGQPGAHPVIVLGHGYWSSRFGNDPGIVNQTVTVNGHPMVVIGVAAVGFNGILPGSTPDLYVPIAMQKAVRPTWDALDDVQFRWLSIFARLRPGIALRQAQAATDVAYRSITESELARNPRVAGRERDKFLNHRLEVRLAAQGINGLRRQWEKPLVVVMTLAALVLLITCSNVAGLMLARAAGRQREIAIRLALGAGRAAVVKQLLIEGLVLFLSASVLGLIAAVWAQGALIHVLPDDYSGKWLNAALDLRVLAFNIVLAAGCGLLFGLIPALGATRPNVAVTLKDQASQASGGGTARMRKVMVTAQVAFSLTLLAGAGLFSESLFRLTQVDLGFRAERLLTFSVDATPTRPGTADAVAFYRELQERLDTIPGVVGAAASNTGPFSNSDQGGNITVEGYRGTDSEYTGAQLSAINPGFFRALGIPLHDGREFTARDEGGSPKVVVVNQTFVKRYFGSANPIGRRMTFGSGNVKLDREIVGVVADSHKDVRKPAVETVYFPYTQWDSPERLVFYLRTAGDDSHLGSDVRRLVRSLDPNVPIGDPEPMALLVRNSIYTDRLIALLSGAFGVLAALLAALGLYGVVGYAVSRRTAEIGVRIALGAFPGDVMRMVLWEAAKIVSIGIVIGAAASIGLGRFVQSQLFGIQPGDPLILAGAVTLMAVVTVAAAFVPAWRASRIDPIRALRYE